MFKGSEHIGQFLKGSENSGKVLEHSELPGIFLGSHKTTKTVFKVCFTDYLFPTWRVADAVVHACTKGPDIKINSLSKKKMDDKYPSYFRNILCFAIVRSYAVNVNFATLLASEGQLEMFLFGQMLDTSCPLYHMNLSFLKVR